MAQGRTTRRCGCTFIDSETGKRKQYGDHCPKLRRKDGSWDTRHGTWYAIYPVQVRGKRRTITRGGFETKADAHAHMEASRAKVAKGVDLSRERVTVEEFLTDWLKAKNDVRATTLRSYRGHVKRYFVPCLGWHRLCDLRTAHVAEMLTHVIASPATKQRVRASLRSALSDAVREGLLSANPAAHVRITESKRPKPMVWTPALEAQWKATGRKPSPVTIWRPDQLGAFLDKIAEHRLYAYFHLLAYRGLRRGEGLGTLWTDVELDGPHPAVTVRRQITRNEDGELVEGPPKSDAGERVVPLDPGTVRVLRLHGAQQARERLRAGGAWLDTGRVFTSPLGATLDPNRVGKVFVKLVEESKLPPVRLHDLRHCASSLVLASGGNLKDAQTLLGHSSMSLTANTYSHLFPDHMAETANRAAAVVPRQAQV